MSDTIKLKTLLLVNDMIIPLNDFKQQYIGNVMNGIVASLGSSSTKIIFSLNKDDALVKSRHTREGGYPENI